MRVSAQEGASECARETRIIEYSLHDMTEFVEKRLDFSPHEQGGLPFPRWRKVSKIYA